MTIPFHLFKKQFLGSIDNPTKEVEFSTAKPAEHVGEMKDDDGFTHIIRWILSGVGDLFNSLKNYCMSWYTTGDQLGLNERNIKLPNQME